MKPEHSQEFQELLTRDYPAVIHLVLWAHSLIYILLYSVVFWCSQHWHQSWTVHHTFISPLCNALMYFCRYTLPSLCHPHLLSTIHNTLTCHATTMLLQLNAGPTYHWCFLNIWLCPCQSSGSLRHSVSVSQRHWHTISLNVRGFAGHHTTRCCCPLLQYFKLLYFSLYISRHFDWL
jgi:hypothetical protein